MCVCHVLVFMGSFVISCISRSLHCFLSNCSEVAALSCKFSRTCRWIIALRMSGKPPIRQAQHCVLGFGCIKSGRQGSGLQRGAPREHWSGGSHEQVGLPSELFASHVVLGWCRWLGEAVLLPEGCAGAVGCRGSSVALPGGRAACHSHCILWALQLRGRPPGAASKVCLTGHV